MSRKPRVSIGMPVYNAELYLEEALSSLLAQDFEDFEIVISDNCSTDGTRDIIEKFAALDDRIQVFRQKENIGAMANFGAVLDYATGDYFMWRSYDDWSDKNYISALCKLLDENPECSLAAPRIVRTLPDKSTSAVVEFPEFQKQDQLDFVKQLLRKCQTGWLYGLYRLPKIRKAYRAAFDGFPHIWAQDNLILLPFLLEGGVLGTNETTFYQRETGNGDSVYRPKTLAGRWALVRDFYRYSRQCLAQVEIDRNLKTKLFWSIVKYTNDKSEKFKRIIRPFLAWPFVRSYEVISGKTTGLY